jgi:hypothetical protein
MKLRLFHYTNPGFYEQILQDLFLKPSVQKRGQDAIAGTGIYLTDLPPYGIDRTDPRQLQALATELFGTPFAAYKVECFFELELENVEPVVLPLNDQGRRREHIFIYRSEEALPIDDCLINHGQTGHEKNHDNGAY